MCMQAIFCFQNIPTEKPEDLEMVKRMKFGKLAPAHKQKE